MKSASLLLIAALTTAIATGCAAAPADESTDESTQAATGRLSSAELARTKAALRAIANANMGRTDNAAQVRAEVEPLVTKLARHFGQRTAASKLPLVEGAWRQLWTDFPYPMTPFIAMDARQVYQVVDADGHYWNIGDQKAIGFIGMTGVLRGAFVPNGSKIELRFTNVGFRLGRLSRGQDLVGLADGLESGARHYISLPGGGKAPNGPVNIEGTLETVYVDGDLRVDIGTQDDFVDASGRVQVEGYGPKIFVLDRVSTPAK
jgi:hypothetical protein